MRQEALRGLHYLFLSADFKAMLGVSDRGALEVNDTGVSETPNVGVHLTRYRASWSHLPTSYFRSQRTTDSSHKIYKTFWRINCSCETSMSDCA